MEIEMKALLTKEQFIDLLAKNAEKIMMPEKKVDKYYSKYNTREVRKAEKEPLYRIRSIEGGSQAVFTKKIKNVSNGVEQNVEKEFSISNAELMEEFVLENGFHKWFEKRKLSFGWFDLLNEKEHKQPAGYMGKEPFGNMEDKVLGHVEVEIINDDIYAVEVEVVTKDKKPQTDDVDSDGFFNMVAKVEVEDRQPDNNKIISYIERWFENNGLKVDERSWVQIIEEHNGKKQD